MNRREQRPRVDREPISSNQRGKADGSGKRWVGRWVNLGKGGQVAGTWTGFSRLFPLVSTQVVDFPHLRGVRLFWEGMKWVATGKTRIKHGIGKGRPDKEVTEQVWVEKREIFHAFSGFIMLYHQDDARNYAIFTLSRVRPILDANLYALAVGWGAFHNWVNIKQ